jgi:hypothetical protein
MTSMYVVCVQLVCILFFIPEEDVHLGLLVSVFKGVRVLGADVLHCGAPISVIGRKDPH